MDIKTIANYFITLAEVGGMLNRWKFCPLESNKVLSFKSGDCSSEFYLHNDSNPSQSPEQSFNSEQLLLMHFKFLERAGGVAELKSFFASSLNELKCKAKQHSNRAEPCNSKMPNRQPLTAIYCENQCQPSRQSSVEFNDKYQQLLICFKTIKSLDKCFDTLFRKYLSHSYPRRSTRSAWKPPTRTQPGVLKKANDTGSEVQKENKSIQSNVTSTVTKQHNKKRKVLQKMWKPLSTPVQCKKPTKATFIPVSTPNATPSLNIEQVSIDQVLDINANDNFSIDESKREAIPRSNIVSDCLVAKPKPNPPKSASNEVEKDETCAEKSVQNQRTSFKTNSQQLSSITQTAARKQCCNSRGSGRRCRQHGCTKGGIGATQFCIKHGGGKRCQQHGCTKSARPATQFCFKHGGGKRCQQHGCTKSAQGATQFCIEHGGGKRCQQHGCTKSAQGATQFCIEHGGGKRCQQHGCTKSAQGATQFCAKHGGGKRCQQHGCTKVARGATQFCIEHGGGKRCQQHGCTKSAQRPTQFCIDHGGGKRCQQHGCTKSAQGATQFCIEHGGGKRCQQHGCTKSAQRPTQFCKRHGGGKRCQQHGCTKSALGATQFCAKHGGGKRCQHHGCTKLVIRQGYCREHLGTIQSPAKSILKAKTQPKPKFWIAV